MPVPPVVLFVYDRPEHTRRTLEALAANDLASEADLTVFCDGPKETATPDDVARVERVREIVGGRKWCRRTIVHEHKTNQGLARSIRDGIDHLLAEHDRVVVLEDDILTSPGFLSFMRDALETYESADRVKHVSAYIPRTSYQSLLPQTFMSGYMSCWGWGTWKRAWTQARWDPALLLREIDKSTRGRAGFDLGGTADFSSHLQANVNGHIQTWAVMWAASIYLADGLCLGPGRSLVRNIGTDGSGIHFTSATDIYDVEPARSIKVKRSALRRSRLGEYYLRSFFRYGRNSSLSKRSRLLIRRTGGRVISRLR